MKGWVQGEFGLDCDRYQNFEGAIWVCFPTRGLTTPMHPTTGRLSASVQGFLRRVMGNVRLQILGTGQGDLYLSVLKARICHKVEI